MDSVVAHPSPSAHINDLPQEILYNIFSLLLTTPVNIHGGRKIWRIARVCKRWMSAITSMSQFWSNFELIWADFYYPGSTRAVIPVSFLDRCIHYSDEHDLCITISNTRGINLDFVKTLQRGSRRLKRLKVEVLTDFVRIFEESGIEVEAPNLEHLDVAQLDDVFVEVSDFLTGIRVSPALSSLALRRLSLLSVPKGTSVPWDSLTHLTLAIYTSDAILVDLLSQTTHLRSLTLTGTYIERHSPTRVVTLEHLSELALDTYTSSYLANTLKHLQLPSLNKLHYVYGEFSAYKQLMLQSLFEQATGPRETITEVVVEDVHIALGFHVANFFPNVKALTMVDMRPWNEQGETLREVTADSDLASCLNKLPCLREVRMVSGHVAPHDLKLVLELVAARNKVAERANRAGGARSSWMIRSTDKQHKLAKVVVHLPVLAGIRDSEYLAVVRQPGLRVGEDIVI